MLKNTQRFLPLLLVGLLFGCSASSDNRSETSEAASPAASKKDPTKEDLQAQKMLIEIKDLPKSSWKEGGEGGEGSLNFTSDELETCLGLGNLQYAGRAFKNLEDGPTFVSSEGIVLKTSEASKYTLQYDKFEECTKKYLTPEVKKLLEENGFSVKEVKYSSEKPTQEKISLGTGNIAFKSGKPDGSEGVVLLSFISLSGKKAALQVQSVEFAEASEVLFSDELLNRLRKKVEESDSLS